MIIDVTISRLQDVRGFNSSKDVNHSFTASPKVLTFYSKVREKINLKNFTKETKQKVKGLKQKVSFITE